MRHFLVVGSLSLAFVACLLSPFVRAQSLSDLHAFLQKDAGDPSAPENLDLAYRAAKVTLHGGDPVFVVYFTGKNICGSGGCVLQIYVGDGHSFRSIASTTVTQLPIRILNSTTNGWRDIGVITRGHAPGSGYEARLRFNGHKYPSNPSLQPWTHRSSGTTVLSELTPAIPLFSRDK